MTIAYIEERDGATWLTPTSESPVTIGGASVLERQPALEVQLLTDEDVSLPGWFDVELDDDVAAVQAALSATKPVKATKVTRTLRVGADDLVFESNGGSANWPQSWLDRATSQLRFVQIGHNPGHWVWDAEPGHDAWIEANHDRDREREASRARAVALERERELQERRDDAISSGRSFVNPYTFVPLPGKVERSAPKGHAAAAPDCHTGFINVEYTFTTPLMMPVDWNADRQQLPDQPISVPGSSVRGSVRSLFETLTNSCLSVLDADYLPVHRSALSPRPDDRLAIVERLDGDKVTQVTPTSEVVWIPVTWLHAIRPAHQLRSGDRITFDPAFKQARHFGNGNNQVTRTQLAETGKDTLRLGGDWVVHLTDAGTKGGHPTDHIYAAVGRLETEPVALEATVWDDFRALCRYSADVTGGHLATSAPPLHPATNWPGVDVRHKGTLLGKRRKTDGALAVGDTVWITRSQGGERLVNGLKMASNWREFGRHAVRDRVPDPSLLPCKKPDELCPACATFGFVEPRSKGASAPQAAEQNAYASHVKFGEFESNGDVSLKRLLPPPTRSPRASAGNFYLKLAKDKPIPQGRFGKPAAHWGVGDSPVRLLAGRKYYWHGQEPDNTTPTPRHIRRGHYAHLNDGNNHDVQRWFANAGTTVAGRVYFENLDDRQLGFLLLALDPRPLSGRIAAPFPTGELATHLGGGKGLGYGTATVSVDSVVIQDAADRYREAQERPTLSADDAISAALETLDPNDPCLTGLVRALGTDSVPASRLWYPTMGDFNKRGPQEQKAFDESHKYYARFSGGQSVGGNLIPMRILPDINDESQFMSNADEG